MQKERSLKVYQVPGHYPQKSVPQSRSPSINGNITQGQHLSRSLSIKGNITQGQHLSMSLSIKGNITQGHYLSRSISIKGNTTQGQHLSRSLSLKVIIHKRYPHSRSTSLKVNIHKSQQDPSKVFKIDYLYSNNSHGAWLSELENGLRQFHHSMIYLFFDMNGNHLEQPP